MLDGANHEIAVGRESGEREIKDGRVGEGVLLPGHDPRVPDAQIDLGNGNYAFYAHMIPGSQTVKLGDNVSAGQVIGRLGNSGNSTAPHLHFHVGDAPSPLGTEGVPFVIDEYSDLGIVVKFLAPWTPSALATTRRRELPFENHVVRFKQTL